MESLHATCRRFAIWNDCLNNSKWIRWGYFYNSFLISTWLDSHDIDYKIVELINYYWTF